MGAAKHLAYDASPGSKGWIKNTVHKEVSRLDQIRSDQIRLD